MDGVIIGVTAALLLIVGWWWNRTAPSSTPGRKSGPFISPTVTIVAQPPLNDMDVYFFNLLSLAVQDRYLLLAQVPLWCLVDVRAPEPKERKRVLGQIALKRVDFALVHPGTKEVEAVVQLEQPSTDALRQQRDRLLDTVLQMAGLKLVKLEVRKTYTVSDLSKALGIETTE